MMLMLMLRIDSLEWENQAAFLKWNSTLKLKMSECRLERSRVSFKPCCTLKDLDNDCSSDSSSDETEPRPTTALEDAKRLLRLELNGFRLGSPTVSGDFLSTLADLSTVPPIWRDDCSADFV